MQPSKLEALPWVSLVLRSDPTITDPSAGRFSGAQTPLQQLNHRLKVVR